MDEEQWSRFCGGLLGYIWDYYSPFLKTDYKIDLYMSDKDILEELYQAKNIDDLSPQLKKVALQYKKTLE